jgi:hypothetical protein
MLDRNGLFPLSEGFDRSPGRVVRGFLAAGRQLLFDTVGLPPISFLLFLFSVLFRLAPISGWVSSYILTCSAATCFFFRGFFRQFRQINQVNLDFQHFTCTLITARIAAIGFGIREAYIGTSLGAHAVHFLSTTPIQLSIRYL